jgi:diaminopimelate epimerase
MDRVSAGPDGLSFVKGHGTGNDFVLLPDPDGRLALTPTLIAELCDRRRGIGADGVLRVVRTAVAARPAAVTAVASRSATATAVASRSAAATAGHPDPAGYAGEAEWFMDYWNADGSYAEMCGNGVRVFTRYLVDAGLAAVNPAGIPVATRAGVVRAVVGEQEISAGLALPRIGGPSTATLDGQTFSGTAVDCGNPHFVCAGLPAERLSTLDLTRPPEYDAEVFPAGVNVEFVSPAVAPALVPESWAGEQEATASDFHVRMRVYERGSGETLSCGSGACAVAAVTLRDAGRRSGAVTVDVPGGRLTVTLEGDTCWLAGPAVIVATGTFLPPR